MYRTGGRTSPWRNPRVSLSAGCQPASCLSLRHSRLARVPTSSKMNIPDRPVGKMMLFLRARDATKAATAAVAESRRRFDGDLSHHSLRRRRSDSLMRVSCESEALSETPSAHKMASDSPPPDANPSQLHTHTQAFTVSYIGNTVGSPGEESSLCARESAAPFLRRIYSRLNWPRPLPSSTPAPCTC